jgi:hypothetical protein
VQSLETLIRMAFVPIHFWKGIFKESQMNHRQKQLSVRLLALAAILAIAPAQTAWAEGSHAPAPTAPVDLGSAGQFVILSESGITDVPSSTVTGNVGTSPITGAANHLTCTEVTGKVYSVDAAGPGPCSIKDPARLTAAIGDMRTAFTDAAGRAPGVGNLNRGSAGEIGGLTLIPGVYKWTTGVTINKDVYLSGKGVYIFEIAKNLVVGPSHPVIVHLTNGAQAQNVFWQVGTAATIDSNSEFAGIILAGTGIQMLTGASVDGRLFAQTAVTLQKNDVMQP